METLPQPALQSQASVHWLLEKGPACRALANGQQEVERYSAEYLPSSCLSLANVLCVVAMLCSVVQPRSCSADPICNVIFQSVCADLGIDADAEHHLHTP